MEMRNLLFGVILGLLAVVQSTPAYNVTQILTKPNDDVLEEVMRDGYLVDESVPHSLTTESPGRKTTIQTSRQPIFHSEIEGSAEGEIPDQSMTSLFKEHHKNISLNVTHAENSASITNADNSSSASPTIPSPHPDIISSSSPSEARSNVTSTHILISKDANITESSGDFSGSEGSGSGSGDGQDFMTMFGVTSHTQTENITVPTIPSDVVTTYIHTEIEGSGTELSSESGKSRKLNPPMIEEEKQETLHDAHTDKVNDPTQTTNKGHQTPGWIIIVAFVVGVAALVLICIAIATRDKWNGPNQAFEPGSKSSSSNQQREQEMETFMHKESPKENGKAAEYTVIPLDELPENYSSH